MLNDIVDNIAPNRTQVTRPRRVLIIVENLPVPFDRRVWSEATTLRKAGYLVKLVCILVLAGVAILPAKSTAANQREPGDAKEGFHSAPIARHVLPARNTIQALTPGVAHPELAKRTKPGHLSQQNKALFGKVDPDIPAHAAAGGAAGFNRTAPHHLTHARGVAPADSAIV